MKRRKRPFNRRRLRWRLPAALLSLLLLWFALDRHVVPLILQYSTNEARRYTTIVINEAVTAVLSDLQPEYNELVTVTRDENENVTSVETDMRRLNQVKAMVSTAIAKRIGAKQKISASLPLGTLLGSHLFAGRGPVVSIPVGVSGSAVTTVVSRFEAAGVNQTSHRVEMEIHTTIFVAAPTAPTSIQVDSTFIIAESILLGKVPNSYTTVTGDNRSAAEQIYDFGSE